MPSDIISNEKEIIFDRWDRIGVSYNIIRADINGSYVNNCKKGNLSTKRAFFIENPVCKLIFCQLCGDYGSSRKICYRSDMHAWNRKNKKDYTFEEKNILCMSCANKIRPLLKKEDEAEEINRLAKKLNSEILKWQKSQTLAN